MASEPIPKAYKPWIIGLATILVGSLLILSADVGLAFVSYSNQSTPLWVILVGVLAALGVGLGFGGLFVLMATAGFHAWRDGRRVQVLPPE